MFNGCLKKFLGTLHAILYIRSSGPILWVKLNLHIYKMVKDFKTSSLTDIAAANVCTLQKTRGLYHVPERRYFSFSPGRFFEVQSHSRFGLSRFDLIRGSVIRGSVTFEVRSFEVRSLSRFGPFRGSVIRGSVTFELQSFEVRSYSRFSHSRFGHSRFGHSTFSLSRFGLSRFGHSRFGPGFII
jgi:hypothetical protein